MKNKPLMREQFFEVPTNVSIDNGTDFALGICGMARGCNWWIGDLGRRLQALYPNTWNQAFPEWVSPGWVERCIAVAKAYPKEEDRNINATWTIHMREANKPDRIQLVQAHVEAGRTSDEARKANSEDVKRWLLAIDVNYYLHRFWFSGAGVEAAKGVSSWVQRTVTRLKEKGLTDVVCCFDASTNHRKELTATWDDKYKDRPKKDEELVHQLHMVRNLLDNEGGFLCVSIDGMEADDVMASYAKQFAGRVTLLTQDKDVKQCLSEKCNMLLDVEWNEDETTGNAIPTYKWLTAKQHTEETGIPPESWTEFQMVMGDNVDGIKGAVGIGEKGAADLIKTFGTVQAAIHAALNSDERIKPAKRQALIEFEAKAETTRKLVTLRTDLELPGATKI